MAQSGSVPEWGSGGREFESRRPDHSISLGVLGPIPPNPQDNDQQPARSLMSEPLCIDGHLDAAGKRFGLVASRFNHRIVDLLTTGAMDCLERHGAAPESLCLVRVPGAWEIPQALEELAASGRFDGLISLGVVIRGETPHFDFICQECGHGVSRVAAKYRVPISFGVLTCDDSSQAMERAGGKAGNKGWEAAQAAIEMASLFTRLRTEVLPASSGGSDSGDRK